MPTYNHYYPKDDVKSENDVFEAAADFTLVMPISFVSHYVRSLWNKTSLAWETFEGHQRVEFLDFEGLFPGFSPNLRFNIRGII